MPENKLVDAAREFLHNNPGQRDVDYLIAFAEQQIALAVAEERKRLFKALQKVDNNALHSWTQFHKWYLNEFSKEIGGTDANL